jgi:hypothetical protein
VPYDKPAGAGKLIGRTDEVIADEFVRLAISGDAQALTLMSARASQAVRY